MASGKTTVAKYLETNHKYKLLSLADPIRKMEALLDKQSSADIVKEFFDKRLNFDQKHTFIKILDEARLIPREEPKPRRRLQFIGTEGARTQIYDRIWIDYTLQETEKYPFAVIDDVRFLNEFNAFRERGAIAVVLSCGHSTQRKRIEQLYGPIVDENIFKHPSELDTDKIIAEGDYDLIIDTSGKTVEELHEILRKVRMLWSWA